VSGELELPEGKAIVGIEDHATVEDLELELTGADGEPVALKRFDERHRGGERGVHNLHRLGEGEIGNPGLHHIRVKSPDAGEEMIVVVGYEQGVGDALMDVAPGAKLFRRLRGG
jgi:hypothetical protein